MDTGTQVFVAVLLLALTTYVPTIYKSFINNLKLSSIPTVGPPGFFTSYIGAFRFIKYGDEMMQQGYDRYRGSVFKVPTMTHWILVASGPDKIEDIRRATDDSLSFRHALKEFLRTDLVFGQDSTKDESLAEIAKTLLTRNIGAKFPEVRDEVIAAFSDHIPAKSNEWIGVVAYPTMMDIACRASNRMLVGLPLCRNRDYLALSKQFAIDVVKASYLMNMVPSFLKPTAVRFTKVADDMKLAMALIEPLFGERLEQEKQYGRDWPERPNDFISWLLGVVKKEERTLRRMATGILGVNFASVHTTSMVLTHALYDLAARPEYVQPLREEIEGITKAEGWSKASVGKFKKLDSFIRESTRMSSLGTFGMLRKVMKDFTFSDGTTVPAGNILCVAIACIHTDPDIYANPDIFDGFRFERMRTQEGEENKHTFVSLDLDYLLFGQGRHACPGRFFAANEVKAILGHILLNYDVKMANGGGRPANLNFGRSVLPDPKAEVLFRKRI
ncbi:hypothetical protein AX15_004292 [Amanita polypyramis BW_CC]|nr:hypothetical protein AX15_004292 [Amanita polypyramis BW_CC]